MANFAKRDYREESKNNLSNNIFGKTSSGKATRAAALATLVGVGGLGYVNRKSLKKPLDLFTRKIDPDEKQVIKTINRVNGEGKVTTTTHNHNKRGFLGTDRALQLDNIGKAALLGTGAVMLPTGAGYVFADPDQKKEIKQRVANTYGQGKQLTKSARNWVNTLDRMERWS